MKLSYSRRYRRSTSRSRESVMFKKDGQHEHAFFTGPSDQSFFKPNIAIQRKCAHCEAEEKTVKRMASEEKKKVQKKEDKKEEDKTLHRQGEKKEEEMIQKVSEKKDEEVHREPEKEEEKNHKMEDKKDENELHRTTEKKEEEKSLSKKEISKAKSTSVETGTYIRSLNSKGTTLPKDAQHFFGERMGHDFSDVRIHTDTAAEQSAKDVNAKAYCVDNNIVFNKGQYNPASTDGKKLLAHELTHVMQQKGNGPNLLNRVAQLTEKKREEEKPITLEGKATKTNNKSSHGCGGVEVQGQTDPNYKSSFRTKGKLRSSQECTDCTPPDCITSKGVVISNFKAQPVITLPVVPDGLTKCEAKAVKRFINGTLKRHEQQHKNAFKSYDGTVRTPYDFTGCRADLDSLVQLIHDGIATHRSDDANTLSGALDPFNVSIPCDCESAVSQ